MKSHVHVKIDDSKGKQKDVLTVAKTLTEQLRDYSSFRKLRDEKKKKLVALGKLMGDIWKAFDELKIKDIPSVYVPSEEEDVKPSGVKHVESKVIEPKEVAPILSKEELNFAKELDDIDKKLASL